MFLFVFGKCKVEFIIEVDVNSFVVSLGVEILVLGEEEVVDMVRFWEEGYVDWYYE